jgi:septum formation protein
MSDEKKGTPSDPPPSYDAVPGVTKSGPPTRQLPMRGPQPLELPALIALRGQRVILASASPRRRQLLAQIGLTQIEVIPSTFAENLPKSGPPFDYVLETATQKAMQVYSQEILNEQKGEPALVIAADTIVVAPGGQILEKPSSMKHHVEMLKHLRDVGNHTVYTAVVCMTPLETAVPPGYKLETHVEETVVKFDRAGMLMQSHKRDLL